MKRTKLDRYLLAAMGCTHIIPQNNTPKGDSMTQYPFQPLSKGHRTADHYLDTWIATMQDTHNIDTLYGRIIRTNINYIATGYNASGDWVKIPCANLSTAKLYMGQFMSEPMFRMHKHFQDKS